MNHSLSHYQQILSKYQESAKLTLPELPVAENIEHCLDGIHTELGELLDTWKRHRYYGKELDKVNLKEECGDVLWYVVNLYGLKEATILVHTNSASIQQALLYYKYDHTMNQRLRMFILEGTKLFQTVYFMDMALIQFIKIIEDMDLTLEDCVNANVAKLMKRYSKGKFNAEDALNRDLGAERSILEQ